ncbi:UNVERIFIED_CONTAM: hypothetical protein Slati_4500900 [Sesamum latifolium]|uniref:Myb/SANT-like domain-containing protein n=1 Tax=Sesamum latifolium TaxID=2727402 RepID=A0AAW2ST87_9LAMI
MNLIDEEGTSKPRGCYAKEDKTNSRRTWTQREEEVLVNALRTIVTTSWKCENGFCSGYLNQLESIMCKQLSNTDINSKIHVWKKNYGSLMAMMGKSGFDWDDARCMITVDNQNVWNEYRKIDSSVRTMRYKLWSFFTAWREIFGKDRAVGEVTVEAHPMVNNDDSEKKTETQSYYVPTAEWCPDIGYVGNDNGVIGENIENAEVGGTSTASQKKPTSSRKKRKGRNRDADDGLTDAVNTFFDTAKQHLGELSKKLFVDYDEVEKRAAVFNAVGKVPGIDLNDQILVSDRLVENPKKMDLFFSLPAEARARMVGLMLSGKV